MIDTKVVALALAGLLLTSAAAMPPAHASGQAVESEMANKIPIDGEVRHAMSGIRELVATALPAIGDGKFGEADFRRLANGITDRLQQAAAGTRLPTDMQARLKAILMPLDEAARDLKVKGERSLAAVLAAMEDYGHAVDHAGWPSGKEKAPQSSIP